MTESAEMASGSLIAGRYRLVQLLGRGGMGTVWRAWDEMLDRHVAVKRLHTPPHLSEAEQLTLYERTRREARSAGRISHPNVVVVHDVLDDEQGLPCIVMEYVPARTLADVLQEQGPLPPEEAARVGRGMIAALRAAHAAGVLHRDVKPANVLLGEDGRVVLTDFGIAVASGTSTLTKPGEVIGSIDFLAPERLHGEANPGPASDLWSLGATLYQAVEGVPPFRRNTAIETAYAIATEPAPTPRRAGPLAPLIEELLAKEPERRPTAEEVEWRLREPAGTAPTAVVDRTELFPSQPGEDTAVTQALPGWPPAEGTPAAPPTGPTGPTASISPTAPIGPTGPTAPIGPTGPTALVGPTGPVGAAVGGPAGAPEPGAPAEGAGRRRRREGRGRTGVLVATALAVCGVLVAGAVLWLRSQDADEPVAGRAPGGDGASATRSPSAEPSEQPTEEPSAVPAGYHLVEVPELAISVPVPDGWRETHRSDTGVRFVDPDGLVGLRIDVLDFASSDHITHCEELERNLQAQENGYRRLRMQRTTFRQYPAAVWEFAFQGTAREFRAIDLVFGREGGREYAVYLSAPSADWSRHRAVFTQVQSGLRLPEE